MKILIITEGYFPGKKYGGPPVSINNFCNLMNEFQCYIVAKNHDMGDDTPYKNVKNGWNKNDNTSIMYLSDSKYNYKSFEKIIKEVRPNILYLQSLFQRCVLPCLLLSKKYKLKVLLAPRGELCTGAFKKKYKKIPYIYLLRVCHLLKNVDFQSTSDEELKNIKKYLNIDEKRIYYLTNIPTISNIVTKKIIKVKGNANLIFVSRIVPKKNLLFALNCLKNINGSVTFDIYGPKEDSFYWGECEKTIRELPSNITVNYCGLIDHKDVCKKISEYDAFLFPTLSENFGHVIAESLSVGTPVIISDQTPWRNLYHCSAGWDLSLNDVSEFSKCIQHVIDMDNEEYLKFYNGSINKFKEFIKIDKLKNEYIKCFKEL